jgi:hypothetical protein
MHRFNFIGAEEKCNTSLHVLKNALERLQHAYPETRFMTSLELAEAMRTKIPALLEIKPIPKIRIWLRRIEKIRGFAKLSKISGLALPLWLIGKAIGA